MYESLVGKKIKVVFLDGSKVGVTVGEFLEINYEFKQIRLKVLNTGNEIIIAIPKIDKIEVLGDDYD